MNSRVARYAPSPTGPLHLGNLQTALGSWLQARLFDCEFWLRIEDLDDARCHQKWIGKIVSDLTWLGLDWDRGPGKCESELWQQSKRKPHYQSVLHQLSKTGFLYPCYCSRKDIQELASAPHGKLGTIYPGTCRTSEKQLYELNLLRSASLRFRVREEPMSFVDAVCGKRSMNAGSDFGDFIVYRKDGIVAYHLAVVVDDILSGVTDVFRGEDLLWSVFPQLCLYDALEQKAPGYWHSPLRLDEAGVRLSKRDNSTSLQSSIDQGINSAQIVGQLAHGLGLIDAGVEISATELLDSITPEEFSKKLKTHLSTLEQV